MIKRQTGSVLLLVLMLCAVISLMVADGYRNLLMQHKSQLYFQHRAVAMQQVLSDLQVKANCARGNCRIKRCFATACVGVAREYGYYRQAYDRAG